MKSPCEKGFELRIAGSEQLAKSTLEWLRAQDTEYLVATLKSGVPGMRLDWDGNGVVLDGNHRLHVLVELGFDVNALAREVWNLAHPGDNA